MSEEQQQGAPEGAHDRAQDAARLDAQLEAAEQQGALEFAPQDAPAEDPGRVPTELLIRPLVDLVGGALEQTGHLSRRFIDDELDKLAGAYAPVIDKYFPNLSFGVELQAVLVTAGVVLPLIGHKPAPDDDPEGANAGRDQGAPTADDEQARTLALVRSQGNA